MMPDEEKELNRGGGRAFPFVLESRDTSIITNYGLTVRDWFAGQALVAFGAAFLDAGWHSPSDAQVGNLVQSAYRTADAMLKEREK